MRNNTSICNKLNSTLLAGTLALATVTAAQAQVLGHGSLGGGLGGGLNGTIQSTMGPLGGGLDAAGHGMAMGGLDGTPGLRARAAERRAERLRQRAAGTASSMANRATGAIHPSDGKVATGAVAGLAGAATADVGRAKGAALGAATGSGSSAASHASGAQAALGDTVAQEPSAMPTLARRARHVAGIAPPAAEAGGERAANSASGPIAAGNLVRSGQAAEVMDTGNTGTSRKASTQPHAAGRPSGVRAGTKRGLLAQASGTAQDHDGEGAELPGASADHGKTSLRFNAGTSAPASAHDHAGASAAAGADGSTRHGASMTARVDGSADLDASAQQH